MKPLIWLTGAYVCILSALTSGHQALVAFYIVGAVACFRAADQEASRV